MNKDGQFEFRIDRIRTPHSKAEMIESLKRFAAVRGSQSLEMRDYDAWEERPLHSETISRHFGGWGKALQAAALRATGKCNLDLKEMVAAFKRCWREHRAVPSRKQLELYLDKHNCPFRWKSYLNVWGGLQRLAKLVVDVQNGSIPESQLCVRTQHKRHRHPISLRDRTNVLKRDGYRCIKCAACSKTGKSVRLEVDHIIPVSKGGDNHLENLQTLCSDCNLGKSNQDD
jgi:hypothetical protein